MCRCYLHSYWRLPFINTQRMAHVQHIKVSRVSGSLLFTQPANTLPLAGDGGSMPMGNAIAAPVPSALGQAGANALVAAAVLQSWTDKTLRRRAAK